MLVVGIISRMTSNTDGAGAVALTVTREGVGKIAVSGAGAHTVVLVAA